MHRAVEAWKKETCWLRRGGAGAVRRMHAWQTYGALRFARRGADKAASGRRRVAGRGGIAHELRAGGVYINGVG